MTWRITWWDFLLSRQKTHVLTRAYVTTTKNRRTESPSAVHATSSVVNIESGCFKIYIQT
jgi:hypothetical protein